MNRRMSDDDVNKWRIALFYHYVNLAGIVDQEIEFQRKLCDELDLKGRVRISREGINGVLSGRHCRLMEYEACFARHLEQLKKEKVSETNMNNDDTNHSELDIKYCHLRQDLSVEAQQFDSLKLVKTDHVISLFENDTDSEAVLATTQTQVDDSHLSVEEWNAKLLQHMETNSGDAILVDSRNVYESRVGHFAVPKIPTMLTNTRKYSDLPQILATSQEIKEKKEIFLHCTGGVRCEPLCQYMKTMYPDKEIYQLKGGVQTYLKESNVEDWYKGKNFTFDQRRTDPVHFGEVVGRCIVCDCPHDDYDNGHAPKDNKPARCYNCRILILVCNLCREQYQCWGEKEKAGYLPRLFCGKNECVHEGSAPRPEILLK